MALATTCPQCKTSFKVVPDQLKLRRGLVRCGVCQNVFSGVEHLRYVDKDENEDTTPEAQETITASPAIGRGPAADGRPPARPASSNGGGIPEAEFRGINLDVDSDTSVDDDGRFEDLTKGISFASTHPGSDPLDSDSTDPVTQTMVATSTGNTLTAASSGEGVQGTQARHADADASSPGSTQAAGRQTGKGQGGDARVPPPAGTAAHDAGATSPHTGTAHAGSTPPHADHATATATGRTSASAPGSRADHASTGHAGTAGGASAHAGSGAADHAGAGHDAAHDGTTNPDAADATSPAGRTASAQDGGKDGRSARRKEKKRRSRWSSLIRRDDAQDDTDEGDENDRSDAAATPDPASAHAAAKASLREDDESLNTVFFMADNEAPLPGHEHEQNVQLPASLRSGHGASSPASDLDPDTRATGALIDEANRIWRQQKPRRVLIDEHGDPEQAAHASSGGREGRSSESSERRRSSRRRNHRHASRSHDLSGSAAARFDDGIHLPAAEHRGWLKPAHRRYLTIGLCALAAIQLIAVFRTEIAYQAPFLRPVANAASLVTRQTIQPPMSLSSLSIESFELRNTRQPGQTRMTAILRNRSDTITRWPAMELTLTGPSNAILVRKVLMPSQYLPAGRNAAIGMTPGSEQPLDLMLDTGDLNLAGYSVSLFYP